MGVARPRLSVAEYLANERQAPFRSEFHDGDAFAMAGASLAHNLIVTNLTAELRGALRGKPCWTASNDLRVRLTPNDYAYPDLVVVCGEAKFEDAKRDTLLTPTLVIEVLSPPTEAYDRGAKFGLYRRVESLREYVLVAQDRMQVESYVRQSDGHWLLSEATGPDARIRFASINATAALSEVYDKVGFEDAAVG